MKLFMTNWTVGQTVFFKPFGNRHDDIPGYETSVVALTGDWILLYDGTIVSRKTERGVESGPSQLGKLYASREAYETYLATIDRWRQLGRQFMYDDPPSGVTLDDINKAMRLLGLEK